MKKRLPLARFLASFGDNDNNDWEDDSDENGDNKDDSDDCNHVDNYCDAKPKNIVWSHFSKYLFYGLQDM